MDTVCRLCAKEKPSKQLVNSIEDKTLDIQQKLIDCCRWNSIVTTECETLPKKICNPCYRKLEMCWSFAESVAQAQSQIFSMVADENPLPTSNDEIGNNETVVEDEPEDFKESIEPVEKLEVVLKQEDNDQAAVPNTDQNISDVVASETTSTNRPKRTTKPAPEKYQAGSSEAEENKKSKPLHNKGKAKNSHEKDKSQTKPMEKENLLKNVDLGKHGKQLPTHLRPSFQSFTCGTCGKEIVGDYRFKKHLNMHLDADGNIVLKPHKCQTCGKAFKKKDKLKQHENIHTGAKPHGCDFCDYRTGHYSNYLKHLRQKHGMARETKHLFKPCEGGLTFGKYTTFYEVDTDY